MFYTFIMIFALLLPFIVAIVFTHVTMKRVYKDLQNASQNLESAKKQIDNIELHIQDALHHLGTAKRINNDLIVHLQTQSEQKETTLH